MNLSPAPETYFFYCADCDLAYASEQLTGGTRGPVCEYCSVPFDLSMQGALGVTADALFLTYNGTISVQAFPSEHLAEAMEASDRVRERLSRPSLAKLLNDKLRRAKLLEEDPKPLSSINPLGNPLKIDPIAPQPFALSPEFRQLQHTYDPSWVREPAFQTEAVREQKRQDRKDRARTNLSSSIAGVLIPEDEGGPGLTPEEILDIVEAEFEIVADKIRRRIEN